jgi:hypothetical protein
MQPGFSAGFFAGRKFDVYVMDEKVSLDCHRYRLNYVSTIFKKKVTDDLWKTSGTGCGCEGFF